MRLVDPLREKRTQGVAGLWPRVKQVGVKLP
jgi:hypothetical protein